MKNKKLAKLIISMYEVDKHARNTAIADPLNKKKITKVYQTDQKHYPLLTNIIKEYGLPTFDLVGKTAAHAFWLLVQHSDSHKDFQVQVLSLMKKSLKQNQVHAKNVAYLTDRVRDGMGKKIIFGTQYLFKDKKIVPKPVLYPKKLLKLRKEYGLPTIADDIKKMNKEYKAFLK